MTHSGFFWYIKSMEFIEVKCEKCGKSTLKPLRRVKESKKRNWKNYCNFTCQYSAKNKQKLIICANPSCHNSFLRKKSGVSLSGNNFCSRSCAAVVNNKKHPKRKQKIKICRMCGRRFTGDKKYYCSLLCKHNSLKVSKEKIINDIKTFYRNNGRIPVKREYIHTKATRARFGSWNKAIIAAGFDPNPVLFAKKHIALDGHKCDSFAEFILDNWLFKNNIPHEIHVPYPSSLMSSDFLVGDMRLEFIGLENESKKYDRLLKRKRLMIKNQKFKVKEIYPRDLFPKNNLDSILEDLKSS